MGGIVVDNLSRQDKQNYQPLLHYKQIYALSHQHLRLLADSFKNIDRRSLGYLQSIDLLFFLEEEPDSIVRPYSDYLLEIFANQRERVQIVEWVNGVCSFCLSTEENLVKLLFEMLDKDFDKVISKKDIISFMAGREQEALFFKNDFEAVQWLAVDRAEHITFEQFKKLIKKIWFLIYPLIILQEKLQSRLGGRSMWKELFDQRQSNERKNKINNRDRLLQEKERKRKLKLQELKMKFEEEAFKKSLEKDELLLKSDKEQLGSDTRLLITEQARQRRTSSDYYKKKKA